MCSSVEYPERKDGRWIYTLIAGSNLHCYDIRGALFFCGAIVTNRPRSSLLRKVKFFHVLERPYKTRTYMLPIN